MALSTHRASASFLSNESTPPWEYDVFLSFRGVDTRKGFVSHLYGELCKWQGIRTFFDDRELEGGSSIGRELPSAIAKSHTAIVVLSPNYASSKWCLKELTTILQCMEARDSVLPVFYETDPSDVGNQRGCFAEAFAELERNLISTEDKEKVVQWKADLKRVSKITGKHWKNFKCERELIEDIVKWVWMKVQATFTRSDSSRKLVGTDYAFEQLSLLLAHDANDVRFIGITGMGGIGKTTLAKLVYDKICHHFEVHCFLANVREVCAKNGIVDLAKKLFSPFLRKRIAKIWDEELVSILIQTFLHNKKVLLVLDDVDELKQLEVLAGNQGWFGMGSRIIVTTRNQRLLVEHGIETSYEVQGLNDAEALELFSLHAFKKDQPEEDFLHLSKSFINYARGLPLALIIFGSALFKRGLDAWISEWDSLSKILNPTIFDKLKISYDRLEEWEKSIFLDVACFHKGKYTKQVIEILDDCFGISSSSVIDALIERSLLYQDHQKCIWMHDLIQEMARTIIQPVSIEPGQPGTGEIEAISLRVPKVEEVRHWNRKAFSKMSRLRFLEFNNLMFCNLVRLWEGKLDLPNLNYINLGFSNKLMSTPNFSGIPNLVEFGEQKNVINLEWTAIEKIPSSIEHPVGLKDLSSKDNRKYDVFLSFGGEDTRRTFTDHLYCTLTDHQFNVFMYGDVYDYKLEKSNGTVPEHLIQAIERSKVAVVVFSRGYPESVWCLEELVKIMECTKTLDQIFFPIFYDVDPSNVRNQTGSFAQAFQKYEQEFEGEKVHLWRNALKEAGLLAGLNFRETDRNEGNFIRDVIAQITGKLISTTCVKVPTTSSLVGKDYRVREISKHLDVGGSNDVRILGILGMCGLGKTTVAKAVFNKHHHSFDGASFLENVGKKKLVDLQEQLLSDILKLAYIVVSSIDEGTKEIEQRLGNRKVLVVIDDLDSVEQLDALAIKPDSFGPGSRIIITSRNEHLLKILNVDKICPLLAMNEREALQLLSWHAFGKNYPKEEYVELSRKAVGYCGGLPLALEVLGSYLCTKSTSEWEAVLDEWKISQPYREIHRTLETSYDGLTDDDVKAIFLDISCFFTGMNKDYVMTVLDGCQFYPKIGIQELQDQCLVTVGKEGNLMMHDLIQGMGREIVRAESLDNPGKRSRLWHNEDIRDVLTEQSGTEDVEGLTLDMQASDELSFSSESFRNMQSLRLLKLNNIKLNGSYHNLSKELRWLCWHGFPLEFLPKDFDQPNLVAIDLSYSKLIRVWKDSDLLLEKLKLLNLSHSPNLAQTPDFSRLPNLEEVILNDCESLSEVHSSIGNLERLTLVNLEGCKNLKDLPLNFFNSKSIETLLLNGCSRFENLAEGLGKSYQKTVDGTPIRQILKLSFSSQYVVKESPSSSLLPPSLHGFNYLRKLDLGCCTLTDDEIPKDLGSLISLEDLDLRKNSFCSLPSLSGLSKLETLCLDDCTNLHAIPNLPTNLKVLRAALCTALETMPDFSELSNMRELYLSHSSKLTEIPGLDVSLNSMTRIHMEGCINLTTDFRKNILRGWTSCGYGGIFLNGNLVPDWFEFVERDLVSFHIPLVVGRNFCGLTLFCIYSSKKQHEGPLGILVSNKTKRTALVARITYASVPTSCTLDDHYLWQGQISNYVLSLLGGDEVDIFVKPVDTADASVRVERTGVNLVWDKFMNENMRDSHLHLYDFDQHPDCSLGADGEEPELIQKIVENLGNEVGPLPLERAEKLVDIDSKLKELDVLLELESNDVLFIGIWGMSGIGKTTLAKACYERIRHKFQAKSFHDGVREDSKAHGMSSVQRKLSNSLMKRNIQDWDAGEAARWRSFLLEKKVLIILDDVDDSNQLRELCEKTAWFRPGSRIIITTIDERLLISHGVKKVFKVPELSKVDALKLFSLTAFRRENPPESYKALSDSFVDYSNGLPLALDVLGSFLYGRDLDAWSCQLRKLEGDFTLDEKIMKILITGYEGLDQQGREIFLDIACFFKGEDKDRVFEILDSCGFNPGIDIDVLMEKSLITISDNRVWMHDLLQKMGQTIVVQQSKQPGGRSRLWLSKDIFHVLKEKTGTPTVEGFVLDLLESKEVKCHPEAFSQMVNLRLLKVHNVRLPEGLNSLPNSLRFLEWIGYPLEDLPSEFDPEGLVELSMCHSRIKQLWTEKKSFGNLKIMKVSHSKSLTRTPDFEGIPNLERLDLEGCESLVEIHFSIGTLKKLSFLTLKDCKSLKLLPDEIEMEHLEVLVLSGCSSVKRIPNFVEPMEHLWKLSLDGTGIESIPSSVEHLNSLSLLDLRDCKNLKCLPSAIGNLRAIKRLDVSGCSNLAKLPESLGKLELVEKINLRQTGIKELPSSIALLKNLKKLNLRQTGIKELPSSIARLKNLKELLLHSISLPGLSGLRSLTELDLGVHSLCEGAIPDDIGCLSSLVSLNLSGNNFVSLPTSISQLTKLENLYLSCCRRLQHLPVLSSDVDLQVTADDCTRLEMVECPSNLGKLNSSCFNFINCFGMLEKESYNHITFTMLQRYLKGVPYAGDRYEIVMPGKEIPGWFTHQRMGPEVSVDQTPEWRDNKWMGYALCAVFEVYGSGWELSGVLEVNGKEEYPAPLLSSDVQPVSDHIWLLYVSRGISFGTEWQNSCNQLNFHFKSSGPCLVKSCGTRLVYESDVEELDDIGTQSSSKRRRTWWK